MGGEVDRFAVMLFPTKLIKSHFLLQRSIITVVMRLTIVCTTFVGYELEEEVLRMTSTYTTSQILLLTSVYHITLT